jgi:hypothetical protein
MVMHPQLLISKQYLTLDLLEGLSSRAKEIAQEAFASGERLTDEEIIEQVLLDMAFRSEELRDLATLFAGAHKAANKTIDMTQGASRGPIFATIASAG